MKAQLPYSIQEHKHRFAAWAASRAASTKTCRFSVLQGKQIIEALSLQELLSSPNLLPSSTDMDIRHREWRLAAINMASQANLTGFSHGIAAKLINVYMKAAFVCAGHESHPNVCALHPPIDSLLLDELHAAKAGGQAEPWARARKTRWSNFSSEQYEAVIEAIRRAMQGKALWEVESWWRGHQ